MRYFSCEIKAITLIFSQTLILEYLSSKCKHLERKTHETANTCEVQSQTMKSPIIHGFFEGFQCHDTSQFQIEWLFSLDVNLRLNVTFQTIYIEKFKGYSGLNFFEQNTLEIVQGEKHMMILGKHAGFSLCSLMTEVRLLVEITFVWKTFFHIDFGVMSKGLIVSQIPYFRKYDIIDYHAESENELIYFHDIQMSQKQVYTYKISANTFEVLILNFNETKGASFLFFDGPGFLSSKTEITVPKGPIQLRSFQCVAQVILHTGSTQLPQIDFDSLPIPMQKMKLPNTWRVTGKNCSSMPCVRALESPMDTFVNVTITKFAHFAEADEFCSFGGVALFEDKFLNDSLVEFKRFCNKQPGESRVQWNLPRSMYSKSNILVLTVISYTHYSSLEMTMEVTHSPCVVFRMSACKEAGVHKIYLKSDLCNLIQLSSGLYDPAWVKSKWKNFDENLPISKFYLQIYQEVKNNNHNCYRITGFREGHRRNDYFEESLQLSQVEFEFTEFQGTYQCRHIPRVTKGKHQASPLGTSGKMYQPYDLSRCIKCMDSEQDMSFFFEYSLTSDAVDFQIQMNYWLHSWINILIKPEFRRRTETKTEMPLTFLPDPRNDLGAFVPITRSAEKFLVIRYAGKINATTDSVVSQAPNLNFFQVRGRIMSGVFPWHRSWESGSITLSHRSPEAKFAFPGLAEKVILKILSANMTGIDVFVR